MLLTSTMRRVTAVTIGAVALSVAIAGCSREGATGDAETMQFFLNMGSDTPDYRAFTEIVEAFEAETGYEVQVSTETSTFENSMKVRLAADNVPDLFSTHGWSLLRYSEFLEPLGDQAWSEDVNPALDSAMRDDAGEIYAFPGETNVAGILYNGDVLDSVGVDPASITSWDAFNDAASKVVAQGTSAIFVAGKDQGPIGHIADHLTVDLYDDAQKQEMVDGTFVAEPMSEMLTVVQGWTAQGYFNKDYSSAAQDDMARALADGTTAFEFQGTALLTQALAYNPDANVGFIPLPSSTGGEAYLVGGEGNNSFGVSKTSAHKEEALEFLAFLAQPENAAKLAEASGSAPGLIGVDVDFGALAPSYETYVTSGTTPIAPYFDRVYLPNGAWDTLVAVTDSIVTGQSSVADATAQMERQYDTLYGQ
ncbi:ABC transporter substrate-binding protein [Microbacterium sp. PRC9]|uniref:ABC transporter substrate-binding protein n=1 Tax=Microbacterium sp. PRC9 TaxID=2962591 RepID=UPI002882944F|nr:ABC transporter substrate-binding protein [Microbacterium sp. PRC9]MDT0144837.1 ABC transporter substrate-binding protein [Microbacterium sp. PRC9]